MAGNVCPSIAPVEKSFCDHRLGRLSRCTSLSIHFCARIVDFIWVVQRDDFGSTPYLRGLSHPHRCLKGRGKVHRPKIGQKLGIQGAKLWEPSKTQGVPQGLDKPTSGLHSHSSE
jgi:hypothetical protein